MQNNLKIQDSIFPAKNKGYPKPRSFAQSHCFVTKQQGRMCKVNKNSKPTAVYRIIF